MDCVRSNESASFGGRFWSLLTVGPLFAFRVTPTIHWEMARALLRQDDRCRLNASDGTSNSAGADLPRSHSKSASSACAWCSRNARPGLVHSPRAWPTDATAVISRYCASLARIKPTIMKSAISTSMIAPVIVETRNTSPRDGNCMVHSHSPKKRPLHPRRKQGQDAGAVSPRA